MGGSRKGAQRTKGNTRPSSSSRSAERLMEAGASVGGGGFIGFGSSIVSDLGLSPNKANTDSELELLAVDSDCRMLMKKMSKKDSTTKLKALQEFQAFCASSDEGALKAALPFWPRLYNKLSSDYDRRVREAAHAANGQLVLQMRRNLAPHLKSIMGNLLMGQCDSYALAASAAKVAFQAAFTPAKQVDALLFCKDDIFTHVSDIVYDQTPQTVVESEIAPPQEAEATHSRMVASALRCYGYFLDHIPASKHELLAEGCETFVSNAKFWKYAKSLENHIRGAWFGLVSSVCRCLPRTFDPHLAKLCPLVLGSLDEEDPVVCPLIWEAALHLLVTQDDAWKHVNCQKAVFPKLMSALRKGFDGNASAVCPNLLPFLSKLPGVILTDAATFYYGFFTNMRFGLALAKVQCSHADSSAVVTSYVECMKYVGVTNPTMREDLIVTHLMPVVVSSFAEKESIMASTPLYSVVGDYLRSVDDHSKAIFWETINSSCLAAVDNHDDTFGLDRLAEMLVRFATRGRHQAAVRAKATKDSAPRVRFAEVSENTEETEQRESDAIPDGSPPSSEHVVGSGDSEVDRHLVSIVAELCLSAQKGYSTRHTVAHLKFLSRVLSTFPHEDVLRCLVADIGGGGGGLEVDVSATLPVLAKRYFDAVLLKRWLADFRKRRCRDEYDAAGTSGEEKASLVRLIVCLLGYSDEKGRRHVLDEMCNLDDVILLEELLLVLMREMPADAVVRRWLKGPDLNCAIVDFTRNLVVSITGGGGSLVDASATWRLLSCCFTAVVDCEPVVSIEGLNSILAVLHSALLDSVSADASALSEAMEEMLSVVCKLTANLFRCMPSCWRISACGDLLLAFFMLSCRAGGERSEITDLVASGTALLVRNQSCPASPGTFLHQAATHVRGLLLDSEVLSVGRLDAVSKSVTVVLEASFRSSQEKSDESPLQGVAKFLDAMSLSTAALTEIAGCLRRKGVVEQLMQGKLTFLERPSLVGRGVDAEKSCTSLVAAAYVTSECLANVLPVGRLAAIAIEDWLPHLLTVLFATTYGELILWRLGAPGCKEDDDDELAGLGTRLDGNVRDILRHLSADGLLALHAECRSLAVQHGMLWSYVFVKLDRLLSKKNVAVNGGRGSDTTDIFDSEGSLHILQLMLPSAGDDGVAHMKTALRLVALIGDTKCVAALGSCVQHLPADADGAAALAVAAVDLLSEWKEAKGRGDTASKGAYLFDSEIPHNWDAVCANAEFCKLLGAVVCSHAAVLEPRHWDFILCSAVSWIQSCVQSRHHFDSHLETEVLSCFVFRLASAVVSTIHGFRSAAERPNAMLLAEWDEFFAERLYAPLLDLFVVEAHRLKECGPLPAAVAYPMRALARTMMWVPPSVVQKNTLPILLVPDWDDDDGDSIPVNVKTALNYLCPMLRSSQCSIQLGAYHVLERVVAFLPHCGQNLAAKDNGGDDDDEAEHGRALPGSILSVLNGCKMPVEDALSDVPVGTAWAVPPESADVIGFLLAWSLVVRLFSHSSLEVKSLYATFFRESELVSSLLSCLFRLMPGVVLLSGPADGSPKRNAAKPTMFSEPPSLDPEVPFTALHVQHLACSVYFAAVRHMPALVREWYKGLDRRTAPSVEKYTTQHVSCLLCAQDIAAVQQMDKKELGDMKVKARPTTREVVATCSFEEISFEIVVALSENHPLGAVTIQAGRPVGVSSSQWSYWTLQLTTFLMHQNGSILDGLLLWKRNIDKKFEGVQECYICFYVLHSTTYQLPKLLCRTCKKKFHPSCLYKWFSTSGRSKCPLCRSIF